MWLPTPLLPHPQHPLYHLAPALENVNIPARPVLVRLLWVGGETIADSCIDCANLILVVGEFCNLYHSCQDAESWVVLLHLYSLLC